MKEKDHDIALIKEVMNKLTFEASEEMSALVMFAKKGKMFSGVKGNALDIAALIDRTLTAKEDDVWEVAKVFIATPFITCMECEDEERKKQIREMIDMMYQKLYLTWNG